MRWQRDGLEQLLMWGKDDDDNDSNDYDYDDNKNHICLAARALSSVPILIARKTPSLPFGASSCARHTAHETSNSLQLHPPYTHSSTFKRFLSFVVVIASVFHNQYCSGYGTRNFYTRLQLDHPPASQRSIIIFDHVEIYDHFLRSF